MRTTPALYVHKLLARLQPPFPQSPQESRQLLTLLETSFRKHLDDAHPPPKPRDNSADELHRTIPLSNINAAGVTQRHLNSVLSHPLLDRPASIGRDSTAFTDKAVSDFESAVAAGTVTLDLVGRCLRMYSAGIRKRETVLDHQTLGSKIASWLFSAPASEKQAFFQAPDMVQSVVPVMAIDRQETAVWEWLRLVYERDFGTGRSEQFNTLHDPTWLAVEDNLVSALMRLSIKRRDLNDAVQQFVEACRYRRASERATTIQDPSSALPYVPMTSSWKRLAAAVIQNRHKHGIEPILFNNMLSSSGSWDDAPQYSEAVVNIYNPSAPSAQLLCRKLRNAETAAAFLDSNANAGKSMRKAMLIVLLDASQLSLSQRLRHDAELLLDLAASRFPEFLPPPLAQEQRQPRSLETRIRESQLSLRIFDQYQTPRFSTIST